MANTLLDIVNRQKAGEAVGICSVCSSSPFVIEAALKQAVCHHTDVLIEATANQVNQFGGYTGMLPEDFKNWVLTLADQYGLERDRVILGGDHLGPVAWQKESADAAMDKAESLVRSFAKAGFTKIHLDCSMPLGEEKTLSTETIADRTVRLCRASEEEFERTGQSRPVYVIGSEVPTPGGSGEEDALSVTKPSALTDMIDCFKDKFTAADLPWERVVAAVVQPGVEFGNDSIHAYVPEEAKELAKTAKGIPGIILEGHSTDYQTADSLAAMVRDGIAILKVGPALTFAAREGLFALEEMERASLDGNAALSNFADILDAVMLQKPANWQNHYTTCEPESTFLRKYSFSDRSRYYMNEPEVQEALGRLIDNLRACPPKVMLLSQYMPVQYQKVREEKLDSDPRSLVIDKVCEVLDQYWQACGLI